jgi:hypothetical protein
MSDPNPSVGGQNLAAAIARDKNVGVILKVVDDSNTRAAELLRERAKADAARREEDQRRQRAERFEREERDSAEKLRERNERVAEDIARREAERATADRAPAANSPLDLIA